MSGYLLVHGAFGVGWVWDEVAKRLEKSGHRAHVVSQLPSTGPDPALLGDLAADAQCVRRMLDAMDEPVVLVGHSYSGMVITELADHPKVRHTVYLSAFLAGARPVGVELDGDVLLPVFVRRDHDPLRSRMISTSRGGRLCRFRSGSRSKVALAICAAILFVLASLHSMAPERSHPTTYVIGLHETEGSLAGQEASAPKADHVVRLPAGHRCSFRGPTSWPRFSHESDGIDLF